MGRTNRILSFDAIQTSQKRRKVLEVHRQKDRVPLSFSFVYRKTCNSIKISNSILFKIRHYMCQGHAVAGSNPDELIGSFD